MNSGTGSNNEPPSIPNGMSGIANLNWHTSPRTEGLPISQSQPSHQFAVTSPPQQISLLLSRSSFSSGHYPSPVPSLLSTPHLSPPSSFYLRHSSLSPMSSERQLLPGRSRSRSRDDDSSLNLSPPVLAVMQRGARRPRKSQKKKCKSKEELQDAACYELAKNARRENDTMVYLDGPRVYTCGECRTHLTSHDEIISKSFHGRHGRAYLFDMCVNVTTGPAEDRRLITGLHSVSDIFCMRCKTLIGWTYAKAYEQSQKYKEGKFIIEKINLHMEDSESYQVDHPAGERRDRWKLRSMSWSEDSSSISQSSRSRHRDDSSCTIFEYRNRSRTSSSLASFLSTPNSNSAQLQHDHLQSSTRRLSSDTALPQPPNL